MRNKILAGFVIGLLSVSDAVGACLQGHPTVRYEYSHSNAVFLGTVLSAKLAPAEDSAGFLDGSVYKVRTDKILRGKLPDTVDIFSENSSGRFPMEVGQQYLLFVYSDLGRIMVDNCGNSGPVAETSSVLKQIRQIQQQQKSK